MNLAGFGDLGPLATIAIVVGLAIAAHLCVLAIRRVSQRVVEAPLDRKLSKARTVATLASSIAIFTIYFGALGIALDQIGISLAAYFAGASIIGFAVAFGSQGMVQDIIMGITIVFSNLFDVGDMVEIGGHVGIVRRLDMRFTVLVNSFGAEIVIPNRSLSSVIRYPRGYIRCIVDVTLPADPELAARMEEAVIRPIVAGVAEEFPGILRTPPDYEGHQTTSVGRHFLRIKFRIWPRRGDVIENQFRNELLAALKALDPSYADWMVAVSYEVEQRPIRLGRSR